MKSLLGDKFQFFPGGSTFQCIFNFTSHARCPVSGCRIVHFNRLRLLGLTVRGSLRFLGPFITPKWQVPISLKCDLPPGDES